MTPLLDTHAWVSWVIGATDLDAGTRAALDELPSDPGRSSPAEASG